MVFDNAPSWTVGVRKRWNACFTSGGLSPSIKPVHTGPIPDVAEFIRRAIGEASEERLVARREAEDKARRILDEHAGQMAADQVSEFLDLFNVDFDKGKHYKTRFSPAFVGAMRLGLIAHLDEFNRWTQEIWRGTDEQAAAAVNTLLTDKKALPSAGISYPTMLMYLRSPETRAVWMAATDGGMRRLTGYAPTRLGAGNPRTTFRSVTPRRSSWPTSTFLGGLLDFVLWAAAVSPSPTNGQNGKALPAAVWLFQANPSLYDIDHAVSEATELAWVVRQYTDEVRKDDRVYLWRSGADAGVIATATVMGDPGLLPGDENDPYLIRPETLSKPEPESCSASTPCFRSPFERATSSNTRCSKTSP